MPTKLRSLKKQAIMSCTKRLHMMKNFEAVLEFSPHQLYPSTNHFRSYCKCCNMYVDVILKPLPNEINISGDAVAITCPSVPYARIKNPIIS
jgi:hypothetical protein